MNMEKWKRLLALLLCTAILLCNIPVACIAVGEANESISANLTDSKASNLTTDDLNQNDLAELISNLPEVSDPMGTEYYFYNQLSDIEKVLYWEFSEATWENPVITLSGISAYTADQLQSMCHRALAALHADEPRYRLLWERFGTPAVNITGYVLEAVLPKETRSSEYLIEKSEARIRQIVETVGMEGDVYSRTRDLLELMYQEMDYDPYLPFGSGGKGFYNDSAIGCLIYDTAVCAGFADAVKILCDELNIPCITVGNAGHAWNFVRMDDGKWYSVDASCDVPFDWECNIIGSESPGYFGNSNYFLGDFFLTREGDFTFPVLSKAAYVYSGTYTASYHDAELPFNEPSPTFVYKINDDGISCTIIAYEGNQTGDLVIPEQLDGYTVTAIGDSAFYRQTGFTGNLVIPDTVKEIGTAAFQACTSLTGELVLPNNLEVIGEYAFLGNASMCGSLDFPESLTSIGRCAFYDCKSLTGDIVLPDGVSLGDEIFYNCIGLTGTLYLPDSMVWNGNIVAGTGISKIHVNETNPDYATYDGMLFSKDMKTLLVCPSGKTGDLVVPEGVETIAYIACYMCRNLNGTLTLPQTLKTIEDFAFAQAGLTGHLVIPDNVEKIGQYAFSGGLFEGSLVLSEKLTRIEEGAFFGCSSLTGDLIIPDSVTFIGEWAFVGVFFEGELHMSEGIEYIGSNAISGNFTGSLELKDTNVTLEKDAFSGSFFDQFSCNCNAGYQSQPYFDGRTYFQCLNCAGGYLVENEHSYKSVVTPPTCTEQGYTTYTCNCGESYVSDYTEKLLHEVGNWSWVTEPNCTEAGEKVRHCANCTHSETQTVDPLGHLLSTYVSDGNATCVIDGTKTARCDRNCGYSETVADPGSAIGHSYTAVVTAPTCTEQGYTTYTCDCGDSYVDDYTDKLGHDYNRGSCTRCGEEDPDYTGVPGDLNGDGEVTDADAIYLLYATFDPVSYPLPQNADYNGDGEVTDADAIYLLYATFDPDGYPLK